MCIIARYASAEVGAVADSRMDTAKQAVDWIVKFIEVSTRIVLYWMTLFFPFFSEQF